MVLVTGGRAQRKLEAARGIYGSDAVYIDRLQDIIKDWLASLPAGREAEYKKLRADSPEDMSEAELLCGAFMEEVASDFDDSAVVICDEIGCGIVPLERTERLYRDVTGLVCCRLAERAESVIRVYLGICQRIK